MLERVLEVVSLLNATPLKGNYILGGSWCMYFYGEMLGVKFVIRTFDIDFVVPFVVERNICHNLNIGELLKERGFIPTARGGAKRPTGYRSLDIDIEFLIAFHGKDIGEESVYMEKVGVYAIPLRFIEFLLPESIFFQYKDVDIPLPLPERFHIHKWIVAQRRLNPAKREKDIEQGKELLPYLDKTKLNDLLSNLPRKWRLLYEKSKELSHL